MGGFSGSGSGGVGPAGRKTDGSYGTKKDAQRTSARNEGRKLVKQLIEASPTIKAIRTITEGIKKSRVNNQLAGTSDFQGTKSRVKSDMSNRGDNNNRGINLANQVSTLTQQVQQQAVNAATPGPTNVEMASAETEAERLLRINRRGRRATILNVPEEELTLSRKTLLG